MSLLPPEELELLDLPEDADYSNRIKKLIYITEIDRTNEEEKSNLSVGYLEGTRFNLFTGNQTLGQREQSFKVVLLVVLTFQIFTNIELLHAVSWHANA